MFRNPLSSSRRQWLMRYLQKKLEKRQRAQNRVDVESHAFEMASLSGKFDDIAQADPTRSGEYARWILDLLIEDKIALPEDGQKIFEILTSYHRVKPKLPKEDRQIHKFDSYSSLRQYLLPLLPTLKSKLELITDGSLLLGTESIGADAYQVYQLTTPEAVSEAAKNTGWCVCNPKTAEEYLKDGPLYVILKNDEPHVLAHLETHQVMDVNDNYLLPESEGLKIKKGEEYLVLVSLFKKYLPQFLCQKPLEDAPLFKHGLIVNLECHLVRSHDGGPLYGCLACGFAFCEWDERNRDRHRSACTNISCVEHGWECAECEKKLCSEHVETCCKASEGIGWCDDDIQHCRVCGNNICDECSSHCNSCDGPICKKCSVTCATCSESYCEGHGKTVTCHECEKEICHKCQEDGISCYRCSEYFCEECTKQCEACGNTVCPHCMETCPSCKREVCDDCASYCRDHCQKTFCTDCIDNICNSCGKHSENINACEECEDQNLCEWCAVTCSKCRGSICPDKVIWCPCGAKHSFCSDCAESLMCFCGKIACDPEQHFICSYITRWRA